MIAEMPEGFKQGDGMPSPEQLQKMVQRAEEELRARKLRRRELAAKKTERGRRRADQFRRTRAKNRQAKRSRARNR